MELAISIIAIVTSVLLIIVILIQNKGAGLSQTFGGEGLGGVQFEKRGAEKYIFYFTIVLSILFLGASVAILLI